MNGELIEEGSKVYLLPDRYPDKKILHVRVDNVGVKSYETLYIIDTTPIYGKISAYLFKTKERLEEYLKQRNQTLFDERSKKIEQLFEEQLRIINSKPQYYEQ